MAREQQVAYVDRVWDQIKLNENIEIFDLPGRSGENASDPNTNSPALNTCIIGGVPFSNHRLPPETRTIAAGFNAAPNAYLRLTRGVLLALVAGEQDEQQLLSLSLGNIKRLTTVAPDDPPLQIGRPWLASKGVVDSKLSWEHALLGKIGTGWIINDLGSKNHTMVAVEAGTSLGPQDPTAKSESIVLPNLSEVEQPQT